MSPPDRKSRNRPWVVIFILLSLIAHLLFVLAIVLVSHFMPKPQLKSPPEELASTTLSLQAPPPVPPPQRKPRHLFMPTEPDAGAKHKETLIESDNDARLRSQSQVARDSTSIMPDVNVQRKHGSDLRDAPNAPNKPSPNPSATTGKSNQQQQQQQVATQPPTPASPTPQTSQTQNKKPPPKPAKEEQPHPEQPPTPTVAKEQFDPNGLPVLPALNAETIAPRTAHQDASPVTSQPLIAANSRGAVTTHGDNSPEAMATEFGRYKAKVYRSIGSRWHLKVDPQASLFGVGMVRVQFTISADGTVETKVLEGDTAALQLLLSDSVDSIREGAPYDPFTDSLRKEIAKEEGNDGSSYTDDCTFTIYGGGD
jgi:outer membrane biosynthesis protein TonB